MVILLPITLAVERMIVIVFPYHHKSIVTTKTVAFTVAMMWGLSAILTIIIIAIMPINIAWPLALLYWHSMIYSILIIIRLISIVSIIAGNAFLQYKIAISNRKAKENQRLGNEEEVKELNKLLQAIRTQAKATITLFLVGGIDVIANILLTVMYVVINVSVEPSKIVYIG